MDSNPDIFVPHSEKQAKVLFSKKRMVILGCGIQYGKTISGVVWLKMMMHEFTDASDNFIVASPSYKILEQSTLPPFMQTNGGLRSSRSTKHVLSYS